MDEDCLLLSVYTPLTTKGENDLLPVVVWIHGGAFITSCGSYPMHGPNRIMQVIEIIQYILFCIFNRKTYVLFDEYASTYNHLIIKREMMLLWFR